MPSSAKPRKPSGSEYELACDCDKTFMEGNTIFTLSLLGDAGILQGQWASTVAAQIELIETGFENAWETLK